MTTGDTAVRARPAPRHRRALGAVVVAGLLLGAAGGWAAAVLTRPEPVGATSTPLTAANPAVPSDVATSADLPALGTDLTYVDDSVESLGTTWELQRPKGWEEKNVARGIRWELPGDIDASYSVRVVPTPGSTSTAQLAAGRLADIRQAGDDGSLQDVELVGLTDTTVTLTYVQDGHLKYQHTQFVPGTPTSATSVFEVSTSGRIQDRDGLDALAEHMAASVHRG